MAPTTKTRTRFGLLAAGTVAVLGLALAAPADAAVTDACPAAQIQKIWYGGTSTNANCENVPDQLDHLFYPGYMFTTNLAHTYRADVVVIQLRLRDLSYSPVAVDGYYGTQTAGAISRYQSNHGLIVDGKTGRQTWKSLFGLG